MPRTTCTKPDALLALHAPVVDAFGALQSRVGGLIEWQFDVSTIDPEVDELRDKIAVAAFLLRKLQAIRHVTRDGVDTSVTVVLGLLAETKHGMDEIFRDEAPDAVRSFLRLLDQAQEATAKAGSEFGWTAVLAG